MQVLRSDKPRNAAAAATERPSKIKLQRRWLEEGSGWGIRGGKDARDGVFYFFSYFRESTLVLKLPVTEFSCVALCRRRLPAS